MLSIYSIAALRFFFAILSTVVANRLKISIALMEIITGCFVGFIAFKLNFTDKLLLDSDWLKFCTGIVAIMLTFLAGTELNPDSIKPGIKEIVMVGFVGFFCTFCWSFFDFILFIVVGFTSQFIDGYCFIDDIYGCGICCDGRIWF